jgi:hypothetical protein
MLKTLLLILVLLTSIPAGYLLAWLTIEELKAGKKWFKIMVFGSVLGLIASVFMKSWVIGLAFVYMAVMAGISLIKAK